MMTTAMDDMMGYWEDKKTMKTWLSFSHEKKFNQEARYILPIVPKADRILDVPCGSGYYSKYLNYVKYIGVDQSKFLINHCRRTYKGSDFRVVDARELPFADGSFDCVFCIGLICHGDRADARRTMGEITRVSSRYVVLEHLEGKADMISIECKKKDVHEQVFKKGWVEGFMKGRDFVVKKSVCLKYLSVPDLLKSMKRVVILYERVYEENWYGYQMHHAPW